jgi:hypothetical protein
VPVLYVLQGAEDALGRRLHEPAADPLPRALRAHGGERDPDLARRSGDGPFGGVRGGGAEEKRSQPREENAAEWGLQGEMAHAAIIFTSDGSVRSLGSVRCK